MKILKYSILTFLVILLGYLLIGFINPQFEYESKVMVNASKTHVWNVFTDDKLMKDWMFDLEDVTILSGSRGEVGSEYEFRFNQNGEEMIVKETISEIINEELFSFRLEAEVLSADTRITFESEGSNTSITSVTNVNPKGVFVKPLFYLIRNTFKEQSDLQYLQLKKIIEKTPQ